MLYQGISSPRDTDIFQENLDSLEARVTRWGMEFNVNKSKILIFKLHKQLS